MLKAKVKKLMQAQAAADVLSAKNKPSDGARKQAAERKPLKPNPADIQDEVDEASWESFPASDPPSYTPVTKPHDHEG